MSNKVPTTFEIDGLLTEKDIADRFKVVVQCRNCNTWNHQNVEDQQHKVLKHYTPCINCHKNDYDLQSVKSINTYNVLKDGKRKPKK